ncbi:MAG: dihydropteroate synthase [Salinivirgaceae bacterium]|jgi:dihydropteroate synthase
MSESFFSKKHQINCRGKLIDLSIPKVMGIVNVTPDSFYAQSRAMVAKEVLIRVTGMLAEGADMIDLGAYSSRPGAEPIDEKEEWNRLEPILDAVRIEFPECIISLDTFRAAIAKQAVENYKVDIINDISSGNLDPAMHETIASLKVPYVMMHMVGTPQTMQTKTQYIHLMKDIFLFFAKKINSLKQLGVHDIIIDPGFGFAKNLDQNYEILAKLDEFKIFEMPLLVGLSRKSMLYKFLETTPENVLNGTTVLNTIALQKGASILRVHDVKECSECVKLFMKTQQFL